MNWICLKFSPENQQEPWTLFYEVIDLEKNLPLAYCKRCSKTYTYPRTKSDSNNSDMWKHYRRHIAQQEAEENRKKSRNNILIDGYFTKQISSSSFRNTDVGITTIELNQLLLQTAVACNWPFDQFDNTYFRSLIDRGFPSHSCPQRRAMKQMLTVAAKTARAEIKQRFANVDSRISLALDCWTSPNRWEFMGTLIHVVV